VRGGGRKKARTEARRLGPKVPSRFRTCVLSHSRGIRIGERNEATLFTHEVLSLFEESHAEISKYSMVSAGRKSVGRLRATSRCRRGAIDLRRWAYAGPTLDRFHDRDREGRQGEGRHLKSLGRPRSADRPGRAARGSCRQRGGPLSFLRRAR